MKRLGMTRRTDGNDRLRHGWNYSELVTYVPPLRGLVFCVTAAPPLPRWATVFRPWRDRLGKR